jgi:hypothetical protein
MGGLFCHLPGAVDAARLRSTAPAVPRPASTPQRAMPESEFPSVWTRKVDIVRPAPPGKRRQVIRAPQLTLEWRIFKRSADGEPEETSPNTVFHTGDHLQVRIRPNQDGYIHIIQANEGEDGEMLFPDSRINDGKNFVRRNEEIIMPTNCEPPRDDNCWWRMEPPAGREVFTVIFSREAAPKALSEVKMMGAEVSAEHIAKIKPSAKTKSVPPRPVRGRGKDAGRYAIYVTNTDRRNNEELIAKIVVNHQERSNGQ